MIGPRTSGPVAPAASARSTLVKAHAFALGFDLVGIAALGPAETSAAFEEWLSEGLAGTMGYLSRGAEKRRDTRLPVPGTTHAIVVALDYGGKEPGGPLARYARGDDYHDVMEAKLRELHARIEQDAGRTIAGKPYVDTGPILERDLARRAGLGWFGKNTNLLNPALGSFFFLGALVLDVELAPDAPFEADRCGTCTRCIDACPTDAIVAPRKLDATRCISYLTIELRDAIPLELREQIGELVYGCDLCQSCCPWNVRFARELKEPAFAPRPWVVEANLESWVTMSPDEWRESSRGSPIKRAKRRGFLRNAAVALGNRRDPASVPALVTALADTEPVVRSHAAWALGRSPSAEARKALDARRVVEDDPSVLEEIVMALDRR